MLTSLSTELPGQIKMLFWNPVYGKKVKHYCKEFPQRNDEKK